MFEKQETYEPPFPCGKLKSDRYIYVKIYIYMYWQVYQRNNYFRIVMCTKKLVASLNVKEGRYDSLKIIKGSYKLGL